MKKSTLALIYLLPLISAALLSVFIFLQVNRAVLNNSLSSEEAYVAQTANLLAESLSRIDTAADTLIADPFLTRATYSTRTSDFLQKDKEAEYGANFFATANTLIDHELITDIKVYLDPEYCELITAYRQNNILAPLSDVHPGYWQGILAGSPNINTLFCPSFYLTGREKENSGTLAFVRKFFNISSPTTTGPVAYVAVYFSEERLNRFLRENRITEDSLYYIVNSREQTVASSNPDITGLYFLSQSKLSEITGARLQFRTLKILNEEVYLTYRPLEGTDWTLVTILPKKTVYSEEISFFILLAVILIVVFLVSLMLQFRLLNSTFRSLMREQKETASRLRSSEARALQAQINPHFLYNILDMINWHILSGEKEDASEAVLSLSRFYKMTLSKADIFVPLRDELEQVKTYVKLQNMRFEGRIHLVIDIPDELIEQKVPKLVLQPVVENSILHGIQEKEVPEGTIVIYAWTEENDLVFTVHDDGIGIDPETLATILSKEKSTGARSSGTNIAVSNIHQRLQLLFGEEYGLSFRSEPGEGTEVEIRIPVMPSGS